MISDPGGGDRFLGTDPGDDFLKVTLNKNPTSSYTGRVTGSLEDIWGE